MKNYDKNLEAVKSVSFDESNINLTKLARKFGVSESALTVQTRKQWLEARDALCAKASLSPSELRKLVKLYRIQLVLDRQYQLAHPWSGNKKPAKRVARKARVVRKTA